jgi:hypothetical protein
MHTAINGEINVQQAYKMSLLNEMILAMSHQIKTRGEAS